MRRLCRLVRFCSLESDSHIFLCDLSFHAALTVKICSKEIPSDTPPEVGTILVPSSELKCFINDDLGLVLRSLPWFKANVPSLRNLHLAE